MDATYPVDGLSGEVEILLDRWGVPHIYADDRYDAFLAQGWNAARDRLWQVDFWRRRGLGLLSEVFGAEHVARDRAARLFRYRGDMRAEWLAYGSDTKAIATAFVAGVNAYVALTEAEPTLLPVEFTELGYRPARWAPEDVARIRSHGLFYNLREEVARALTVRDFGVEVEELRRRREPWQPLVVPAGLDLDLLPDDVLATYDLATVPPVFGAGPAGPPAPDGSNNWVLSGSRTTTGRPLLGNDPHRAVTLPGLRYLAHLSCPDFDVIGGGEPGLPGISIGHNGHIAFGLTIFAIDQEDLYLYRTDPAHPGCYSYDGRWEPFRTVTETVPVRGGAPVEVELAFTRHGPVVHADPGRGSACAVRAAWLEPGMAPYLGSVDYMRARGWADFRAAMNRWGAPPENQVYADPGGRIGWQAAGLAPDRAGWDGSLPVPGDGSHEWSGYLDGDALPGAVDPPEGWLATANEMNLRPEDAVVSRDWSAPYRRERIGEVLGAADRRSVADLAALQDDVVSLPARQVCARLGGLAASDPDADAAAGLDLLAGFDGTLAADSAAAALFEVWYRRHLRPALLTAALEPLGPVDRRAAALARVLGDPLAGADARVDLDLLLSPGDRLGPDPDRTVDRLLRVTLAAAVRDLRDLLGPDTSAWAWGRLHVARPVHPLAPLLGPETAERFALTAVPRGGSGETVGNTHYGPDFSQLHGATMRVVVDVGDWDHSVALNSPGQSGDPRSPHYADLYPRWAAGEPFPLCYSRAAVEAATQTRIVLAPPAGR